MPDFYDDEDYEYHGPTAEDEAAILDFHKAKPGIRFGKELLDGSKIVTTYLNPG